MLTYYWLSLSSSRIHPESKRTVRRIKFEKRRNVLYNSRHDHNDPTQCTSSTLTSLEVTLSIEPSDTHPEDDFEKIDDEVCF